KNLVHLKINAILTYDPCVQKLCLNFPLILPLLSVLFLHNEFYKELFLDHGVGYKCDNQCLNITCMSNASKKDSFFELMLVVKEYLITTVPTEDNIKKIRIRPKNTTTLKW
ncbi:hypothetical protein V8G54_029394, partial [Vigna mungo]